MTLRSNLFWGRDVLTGGRIRDHFDDVQTFNRRDAKVASHRLERLNRHLDHVTRNVPYYRQYSGAASLLEFPVLNKDDIRSEDSEMVVSGIQTQGLHVATTSGSTGTPFRVYQDPSKRRRSDAESIYFGQIANYTIGTALWYLRVWTDRTSRGKLSDFARNVRPIEVSSFSHEEATALWRRLMRYKGPVAIIGYSSALEKLARVLVDGERSIRQPQNIVSIIGQSEPLSQESREILFHHTGVYPTARYGLNEVGILAQQSATLESTYVLNRASHEIEVLSLKGNSPASVGELGRVVVTDVVNRAQPMIRYDTGDLAVVGDVDPDTGQPLTFSRLDGRSRDFLLDVNDQPLSPLVAANFWWKYPRIRELQIAQKGSGQYILRLEVLQGFEHEAELLADFRIQVGECARVDIDYGAHAFSDPSGKRRAVIREYDPGRQTDS